MKCFSGDVIHVFLSLHWHKCRVCDIIVFWLSSDKYLVLRFIAGDCNRVSGLLWLQRL